MEQNYFEQFESVGYSFTPEQRARIEKKILEKMNYIASIGVFGKTGVGKSSLCNALFGQELYPVSDIGACTRDPQEELMSIGNGSLKLLDVPGVGENEDRDEEYAALYNSLIPKLDLVLWIIKADDRAFSDDLKFYKKIVSNYVDDNTKPFFIVLNQVEKMNGSWDYDAHEPKPDCFLKIQQKVKYVADVFGIAPSRIVPVSAEEKYNLDGLLDEIVYALPAEKVIAAMRSFDPKTINKDQKRIINDAIESVAIDTITEEIIEDSEPVESESKALSIVQKITDMSINGVSSLNFVSAEQLAREFMQGSGSVEDKINSLIRWEMSKSAMSGFVTGFGGIITIPISVPADMLATWVINARLSAAIAYMYGHNINEDRVRTFVIATIVGDSVKNVLKDVGVKVGQGIANNLIKQVPAKVLRQINNMLGIKLITKAGQKSITSLTKMIPFLGGFIGAGIDAAYSKSVAKRAKSLFGNYCFE